MNLIKKAHGKIIIPSAYYLRGDLRYYYYSKYKKNLQKTKKEIKAQQLKDLKKLLIHAYETVPYYRFLFQKVKFDPYLVSSIKDLQKIPPLTKELIRDNIESLKSTKKYSLSKCYSGGSTGNRVMIYTDKKYKQMARAVMLRDLHTVGMNPGDKVAWIWSAPFENESLKKSFFEKILWKINRRIIFNAMKYTDEQLENWIKEEFNKFKPKFIYGYANAIYDIAKFIDRKKIKIHQVEKIICTAQKLEHRDFIEQIFNCKVIDQYGCREVDSIAIEDNNQVMHTSDDFVIVELDKNNEIMLTPLQNYGMPLIRYKLGDIGTTTKADGKDNSPFKKFSLSIGRSCEILKNKNGEKIHSAKINLAMAKEGLDIGEFQLVQESLNNVKLNIVKSEKAKKKDIDSFCKIIKQSLGVKKIKIEFVNKYPLEKSGKKIGYKCLVK